MLLAAEYGVARNTVRRALDQLASAQLVAARPGLLRTVLAPDDAQDSTPKYRRIAADLRTAIELGAMQPGDRLPIEAALAARHGAARGKVRQALVELDGAGLIESVQGNGRSCWGVDRGRRYSRTCGTCAVGA
jgi:DNA-binding GntR family transcriptional regulator